MERTLVLTVGENLQKEVRFLGWAQKVRDHGKMGFIDLRDRSGVVQK